MTATLVRPDAMPRDLGRYPAAEGVAVWVADHAYLFDHDCGEVTIKWSLPADSIKGQVTAYPAARKLRGRRPE
jgi:hypothetical protein